MRRTVAALTVVAAAAACARRLHPGSAAHTAVVHAGLTLAAVPMLARENRGSASVRTWELLAAQQLRAALGLLHHHVATGAYSRGTDIDEYHVSGTRIAEAIGSRRWHEVERLSATFPWTTTLRGPVSTNLMRLLNGGVYAAIGPSRRSSMVAFSWLSFAGLMMFRRAFAVGVPDGAQREYTRALLLSPSLGFWTSGITKESWTTFCFGATALGAARTVTGAPLAGVPLALGGAAGAVAVRVQAGGHRGMTAGGELWRAGGREYGGAAAFTPPPLRSPLDMPRAAASVLFRPHPGEVHNPMAVAAAVDAALLAAFTVARAGRVPAAVLAIPRRPYVGCALSTTAIVLAYLARVSNLGALARQRTPVLPFYLVALAVPRRKT